MEQVLICFPTLWDRRQLEQCRSIWRNRFSIRFTSPTAEACPWDFNVVDFIEKTVKNGRGKVQGIFSSSDYPGASTASIIARELELAGPDPAAVLTSSHKYLSRVAQKQAVPESVPDFQLLSPNRPASLLVGYPCFVKPVKGAFSQLSARIDSPRELVSFLARPAVAEFFAYYLEIFNRLLITYTDSPIDGNFFIAEALISGSQVTVEGFEHGGEVAILGIVDSVLHPETGSFVRFDYPSHLPEIVQNRMKDCVKRVVKTLGLTDTFFNLELYYNAESDRIWIIEINPRICGQFADLYGKVDGLNSYLQALELAVGRRPRLVSGQGPYAAASSFPLRVFQPVSVERIPGGHELGEVATRFPETLLWLECEEGDRLEDFQLYEDGASYRYGVVNLGGSSLEDVLERFEEVLAILNFRFKPCRPE